MNLANQPDQTEAAYLGALDTRLGILAKRRPASFVNILRGARGAFPALVLERLGMLGLREGLEQDLQSTSTSETQLTGPELHPLDFEWYFTSECAAQIADLLTAQPGDILCLATPTVASAVARRGRSVTLLDHNPLIKLRLAPSPSNLEFVLCDLYDSLKTDRSFPVVFFDSPWYLEPLSYWLWQASQAVSMGGTIAFSLFPPLLRPGAENERSKILAQASTIGEVTVQEEMLSYETPLFEQKALSRSGIRLTTSWRRADLVLIRVEHTSAAKPAKVGTGPDEWESFLIGRQVVKLRKQTRGDADLFLAPLDGLGDYVFPTVSLRDSRRSQIDLWTSRNRVARVGQRALVAYVLGCLATGMRAADVAKLPRVSSLTLADREEVLTNLCLILEIPQEDHHEPAYNRS